MGRKVKWTDEHIGFIKEHQAGITRNELCQLLKDNFDDIPRTLNRNQLQLFLSRTLKIKSDNSGRFEKKNKPWNYKKRGYRTARNVKAGTERVTSKGYIQVKVGDGRHGWQFKHIIEWENVNGKVPDGYCLRFLDNDKGNCCIDNLMLVPRSVHAVLNRYVKADTSNPELNKTILLTETLRHEIRKLRK